jgi:FKBP-type peptidyl-prolyl cis-trans isomerase 2
MVSITPEEGYGLRDESLITKIPRAKMANNAAPQVGQTLTMRRRDGEEAEVTVVAVDESTVTIDGNNPLAGQQLAFEIQLVEIVG